jgi:filamentous hemagglutinin
MRTKSTCKWLFLWGARHILYHAFIPDLQYGFPNIKRRYRATPQVVQNQLNGAEFERQVIGALGGVKNRSSLTVTLANGKRVTTIPDLWEVGADGILEIKNVINLSNSDQLRAQLQYSLRTGTPFKLVVSPRTQNISAPLLKAINKVTDVVGGGIYRYDPATNLMSTF